MNEPNIEWKQSLYLELRPLAEAALRGESPGHSLQPTILINDAYLKIQHQDNLKGASRAEVLAAGAVIMRRMMIDSCRKRKAAKRGGDLGRVDLQVDIEGERRPEVLLELDEALVLLAKDYPRAAKVVELRFYGGLVASDIANHLDVSESTVGQDWRFARAWLSRKLGQD